MIKRCLLIALVCCAPLAAALEDFPRVQHRSLFAADPYSAEPDRPREADETEDEEAASEEHWDYADTGWFGLGFWATPYTRFTYDPYGHAAGFGLEFTFHFHQAFALVLGLGFWSTLVDAEEAGGRDVIVDAGGLEVELGFRWRFLRWDGGALYTDARAVFGIYDGSGPVRTTSNLGGGGHFGVELGNHMFRVFFEGGLEYRAGLNYRNSGWLRTGESNGAGGLHFDLLRVGMRVYF